jgi:hypothetical protein
MEDFDFAIFNNYLNNGARNNGVFARFFNKFVKTGNILENGMPEYIEKLYVEIKVRGDADVSVHPADEMDIRRFSNEYNYFLAKKEKMKDGTPLNQFAFLSVPQLEACDKRGILTVEDLAKLSDEQAKELSLIDERNCAVKFLEMAKNNAIIAKYEDEIKALKQENEALKDKIKALETKE